MSLPIIHAHNKMMRIIATCNTCTHLKAAEEMIKRFHALYYSHKNRIQVGDLCNKQCDILLQRRCFLLIRHYSTTEE